jgi:hypothetical protein
MATLLQLRTKLNGEVGVVSDAETTPWSTTVRNNAIIDGYAELWRVGVWKPVLQSIATVDDQFIYTLSTIRRLERLELVDSGGRINSEPRGIVEDDGSGAWHLRLVAPLTNGYILRVRGWTAYKSQLSGDGDTDDLPAEHNRVPLLKAKAILWRIQLGSFARYGTRQAVPPEMNLSIDQLIGLISAAEREFVDEAKVLSGLRPRAGQTRSV